MRIDKENPNWENRDRFILSKGHGVWLIILLYVKAGLLKDELKTFEKR